MRPLPQYVDAIRATELCNLPSLEADCQVYGLLFGIVSGICLLYRLVKCCQSSEKRYAEAYANALTQHRNRADLFYQLLLLVIVADTSCEEEGSAASSSTSNPNSERAKIEQQLRTALSNPPHDLCLRADPCANTICLTRAHFLEKYADLAFRECLVSFNTVVLDLSDLISLEWERIQPLLEVSDVSFNREDLQSYFKTPGVDEWFVSDVLSKLYEQDISVIEIRQDQFLLYRVRDSARVENLLQQLYSANSIKWRMFENSDHRMRLYTHGESYYLPHKAIAEELEQIRTFGPAYRVTTLGKIIASVTPKHPFSRWLAKWFAYLVLGIVVLTAVLGSEVMICAYPFVALFPYQFGVGFLSVLCVGFCIDQCRCCGNRICRGRPDSIMLDA